MAIQTERCRKTDNNRRKIVLPAMKLFCKHFRIPIDGQWVCTKCEIPTADTPTVLTESEEFDSRQVAGIMMLRSLG